MYVLFLSVYSAFSITCYALSGIKSPFFSFGLVRTNITVNLFVSSGHLMLSGAKMDRIIKWPDLLFFIFMTGLKRKRSIPEEVWSQIRMGWTNLTEEFSKNLISKQNGMDWIWSESLETSRSRTVLMGLIRIQNK